MKMKSAFVMCLIVTLLFITLAVLVGLYTKSFNGAPMGFFICAGIFGTLLPSCSVTT